MRLLTAVIGLTLLLGYGSTNASTTQRQDKSAAGWESGSVNPTPEAHPITIEKVRPATIRDRAKLWTLQRTDLDEWRCIDEILYRESRWIPNLFNRGSGVTDKSPTPLQHATPYGLGQVKGSYKYTKNKPMRQFIRAIKYSIARYGTLCTAKAHHDLKGWY